MNLAYLLRSCHLFSDLNEHELNAVREIAAHHEYRKGQLVFSEGSTTRGLHIVAAGAVKIYRVGPDGRERVFHIVQTGEAFAEAALFMDAYPATAEALAPTTVIVLEKNAFKQLLAQDPKLSFRIIGTLVKWLRQMRDALTDLTLKEVPARFASYILSLPSEPTKSITITVSKTTVAQMIGTTKETFSRLLARLSRHRVLTYRGNQVRIVNRPRLEAIARGDEKI